MSTLIESDTSTGKKGSLLWRLSIGPINALFGSVSSALQSPWMVGLDVRVIKFRKYSAWFIPVLYVALQLLISPLHDRFDEWGGTMQYFAGKEILAGIGYQGWASYFWPPLYSFLMGLGSLIGPGFFVGKLISIIAGAALLRVAYELAIELTNQDRVALLTQVFLVLTPLYFRESLIAHNHMLDAFLFVTGIWLFLKSLSQPTLGKMFVAGLVCGLAGLSRLTSNVLLALPVFLFLVAFSNMRTTSKLAIAFWSAFVLVYLPWPFYSSATGGFPLHTRQELNVCMEVVPGVWGGGSNLGLWQCNSHYNFGGPLDIFMAYPVEYLRNFYQNVIASILLLVKLPPNVMALFVVPAIFESFIWMKPRFWLTLFGVLSLFVVLASQALVPEYALLPWAPLTIIIIVTFMLTYFDRVEAKYPIVKKYHARDLCIVLLVVFGLALTPGTISRLNEPTSAAMLADLGKVTIALKDHDPRIETKVIMAVDPAWAYHAGSKYLVTPLEYSGTVDGLVAYRGLSERIKAYAPKYPSTMSDSELRADYLVYTRTPEGRPPFLPQDLSQFSFLLDPESDQVPENFEPVYRSENVIVYEIDWDLDSSNIHMVSRLSVGDYDSSHVELSSTRTHTAAHGAGVARSGDPSRAVTLASGIAHN